MYIDGKKYTLIDVEIDKQIIDCAEFIMPENDNGVISCSGCWRGYTADYFVERSVLYGVKYGLCNEAVKSPKTFIPYTGSCIIACGKLWIADFLECYLDSDEAFELYFEEGILKEKLTLISAIEKARKIESTDAYENKLEPEERQKLGELISGEPLKYRYDYRTHVWRNDEYERTREDLPGIENIDETRLLAPNGDPEAQYNIGWQQMSEDSFEKHYEKTIKWFGKAAEQGHAKAQYWLGMIYMGSGASQDIEEGKRLCRSAAEAGFSRAQCTMGEWHEEGEYAYRDYREAAKWHLKAAGQGDKDSRTALVALYLFKEEVSQDIDEYVKEQRTAAEHGDPEAMHALGWMHEIGLGVSKDHRESMKWYISAAEQGNAVSQYELGNLFDEKKYSLRKKICEPNRKYAIKYYKMAAEQGDADAMYALGNVYYRREMITEKRKGISKSNVEAVKWHSMAAERGDVCSQLAAGIMYLCAALPENDYPEENRMREAEKWFRSAAEQGNEYAQLELAELLISSGRKEEAEGWLWLAAEHRYNRDAQLELAELLSALGKEEGSERLYDFIVEREGYQTYRIGRGYLSGEPKRNDTIAFKLLKRSAEKGVAGAQFRLSSLYFNGRGTVKNEEEGRIWIERAIKSYTISAERGDADAQYSLGRIYESGTGTPRNIKKAFELYKTADENKRHGPSQYRLGRLYEKGKGVEQSIEQAEKYYDLAFKDYRSKKEAEKALFRLRSNKGENKKS